MIAASEARAPARPAVRDRTVLSWRVSRIQFLDAMTIPVPEPEPTARERAGASVAAADAVAAAGERPVRGRAELRLLAEPEHAERGAIASAGATGLEGVGAADGASAPARRLRLPAPVQLALVSAGEGPGPEVVWASLPQRSREMVLALLARLIDTGAVGELEG